MASLQFAKESILLKAIQDVADNDKRTQSLELSGSTVWKAKSAVLTASLSDALLGNMRLTALNLSDCNVGDNALFKLADAIRHNATLYDLNLANNKLGRPGMTHLAECLADNSGLMTLDLTGHRINSEVAVAFVDMLRVNLTLCKIIWKLEVGGFNLRFTELTNRNTEIDRNVRDGKDFVELLPDDLRAHPPALEPRVVPDPDNEDFGVELGESATVWCQVEGKWSLGEIIGHRKRKVVVRVEETEVDFEAKELTAFDVSHVRDLPNMVMMQNLHEAPLLFLLQRRLKDGKIYTWAGDVLLALNPYHRIPELYQLSTFLSQASAKPPDVAGGGGGGGGGARTGTGGGAEVGPRRTSTRQYTCMHACIHTCIHTYIHTYMHAPRWGPRRTSTRLRGEPTRLS